jgi:outer membrane biosynthesis protein TonB
MEAQAENKNRYIALACTLGFHALLFLLFLLMVFVTPIPPFEIKPVPEIEIGLGMEGMGQDPGGQGDHSKDLATAMDAAPVTKTTASDAPNVITDPTETDVPMKTNPNNTKDVKEEPKTPAEEQASSELLNALAKLKNKNGGKGEGDGKTGGSGDGKGAGVGDGDDDGKGNRPGIGQGKGGFDLRGRSLVNRPDRLTDATEEGIVVVEIVVDANGKVIKATPGQRGSTTFSSKLYSKARQAALSATFSPRNDGSTEQQHGTYTFVFTLE